MSFPFNLIEPESFEPVDNPNNLQQLQNDILKNALTGHALINDGSINIHACHSRKREVEVLKDQLLRTLEADPALGLAPAVSGLAISVAVSRTGQFPRVLLHHLAQSAQSRRQAEAFEAGTNLIPRFCHR